ncbi:HTH domain-containing protein, partial [Bacillus sp. MRMR6]|uniref:HTH domain-containing protein n=1 Tax=Bacillus sp. MRMR6 TaxID=1928617 RepID=UPI00096653FF
MSKKVLAEKEIKLLSNNPYVKSVSPKGVTYTDEFKNIFISENEKGKLPRQIFEECGFDIVDIDVLGIDR